MKLSELIQIAIEALDEDAQQELSFIAYPRHETRYDELRQSAAALRAIAPALVAVSQAAKQLNELHGGMEDTHIPEHCPACCLVVALHEAGVSCE